MGNHNKGFRNYKALAATSAALLLTTNASGAPPLDAEQAMLPDDAGSLTEQHIGDEKLKPELTDILNQDVKVVCIENNATANLESKDEAKPIVVSAESNDVPGPENGGDHAEGKESPIRHVISNVADGFNIITNGITDITNGAHRGRPERPEIKELKEIGNQITKAYPNVGTAVDACNIGFASLYAVQPEALLLSTGGKGLFNIADRFGELKEEHGFILAAVGTPLVFAKDTVIGIGGLIPSAADGVGKFFGCDWGMREGYNNILDFSKTSMPSDIQPLKAGEQKSVDTEQATSSGDLDGGTGASPTRPSSGIGSINVEFRNSTDQLNKG